MEPSTHPIGVPPDWVDLGSSELGGYTPTCDSPYYQIECVASKWAVRIGTGAAWIGAVRIGTNAVWIGAVRIGTDAAWIGAVRCGLEGKSSCTLQVRLGAP